ncbi:MAG: hypothetical protein PSX81_04960 [bacterium]|nr:hypothetical protein [bacterium]
MNQLTEEIEIINKRISGITTAVITSLIILVLVLMQFKIEPPKPEEEGGGVAVSLGEPDAGGPESVPVEAYQPPVEPTFQPREQAQEQTEDPDAVAIPKTPKEVKNDVKTPAPPVEDDIIRKMRENAEKNKNKPSNSGSGTKPGAQGAQNGIPGGDPNGKGTGPGTGGGPSEGLGTGTNKSVNHTFGSRKLSLANNTENCGEKGTVIVDVIVKADGSIIPTGINPSTKSSSQCLQTLAMKFVRNSKFAASSISSADGTITIKFTLN